MLGIKGFITINKITIFKDFNWFELGFKIYCYKTSIIEKKVVGP